MYRMKPLTRLRLDQKIRYRNFAFRMSAAFVVTNYILLKGTGVFILDAYREPSFLVSLLGSYVIAIVLVTYIHIFTVLLDRRFDWFPGLLTRGILQTVVCFIFPGFLAYELANQYFRLRGTDIRETVYVEVDLPIIMLFLAFLNIYYFAHNIYLRYVIKPEPDGDNSLITSEVVRNKSDGRLKEKEDNKADMVGEAWRDNADDGALASVDSFKMENTPADEYPLKEQKNGSTNDFVVRIGTKLINLDVHKEVAIFYRRDGNNRVLAFDGRIIFVNQSLTDFETTYGGHQFFKVNRQTIINREVISSFEDGLSRTLRLLVKPEFSFIEKEFLSVSQDRAARFKEWMER